MGTPRPTLPCSTHSPGRGSRKMQWVRGCPYSWRSSGIPARGRWSRLHRSRTPTANPRSHPQRAEVTLRPERGLTPFQFQNYSRHCEKSSNHGLHRGQKLLCASPAFSPWRSQASSVRKVSKNKLALRTDSDSRKVARPPAMRLLSSPEHATNSAGVYAVSPAPPGHVLTHVVAVPPRAPASRGLPGVRRTGPGSRM